MRRRNIIGYSCIADAILVTSSTTLLFPYTPVMVVGSMASSHAGTFGHGQIFVKTLTGKAINIDAGDMACGVDEVKLAVFGQHENPYGSAALDFFLASNSKTAAHCHPTTSRRNRHCICHVICGPELALQSSCLVHATHLEFWLLLRSDTSSRSSPVDAASASPGRSTSPRGLGRDTSGPRSHRSRLDSEHSSTGM